VATHDINLKIPHGITIVNTDVEILVREDGELLGRIHISRGSIDWIPSKKHRPRRLSWARFADLMDEFGRPVKPKP
jgi:hypothetical protein